MSKRVQRQLADFEAAASELLDETHFWQRKKRARIQANLEAARRQAAEFSARDAKRARSRKTKGIVGS